MDCSRTKYHRVLILFLLFFGIAAGVHALKITLNNLANPSGYIPQIEKSLGEALHAKIKIKKIQWITWGGLGVEINGMSLTSKSETLQLERVVLIFRLLPLLKKQIIIKTLRVADATIGVTTSDDSRLFLQIIREALAYLNKPITSSNGISIGTAIRTLSINNVQCSFRDGVDQRQKPLDLDINKFDLKIFDYFNTVEFNFVGKLSALGQKQGILEVSEKIANISPDEFLDVLLRDAEETPFFERILKKKHHTFSLVAKDLPLGAILRATGDDQKHSFGEELNGKLLASGNGSLNYSGDFVVHDEKGKKLYEPSFSGVIHENGIILSQASFSLNGIPITFGGELDTQDPEKNFLTLNSKAIEIAKLAKLKQLSPLKKKTSPLFEKILKGKLMISELRTYFPKIHAASGKPYILNPEGIIDELGKNLISVKGSLKDAIVTSALGEKNQLVSVDFLYNGKVLQLSKGRIALKKNFIDINNVLFDPKTNIANGSVEFVLQDIPLKLINPKAGKKEELHFIDRPSFSAEFTANIEDQSCSLTAQIDLEKGKIQLSDRKTVAVYENLKGSFVLSFDTSGLSFLAKINEAGISYKGTEITDLSFDIIKKRKFLTHHVKRLAGSVNFEDVLDLYSMLDPEAAKEISAKGSIVADLRDVDERERVVGNIEVKDLVLPYVDEITDKPGTVTVNGKTKVALKKDLSNFIWVSFEKITLHDSYQGELNLAGKAWKVREKLFTDIGIEGTFNAGAMKVAYESIVGDDFFQSTGFEGFYGITGKASIAGKVKGNVSDRPEKIDLKIKLHDLALLDSDNGNLWDKITGNVHVTAKGTTVGKFQYFVGDNRYVLKDSSILLDKEGRGLYRIRGEGFIDLGKYRDDNKLFSRSLKTISVTDMHGKVRFRFNVDEEKEKTRLDLGYDFKNADFHFWKGIHKHEGQRLEVNLKGYLLNDPSKVYFKAEECLIDYLEDKYLLINSEFFDNDIFDIHLSISEGRLDNLLKLIDFQQTDETRVGGDFKGVINMSNFSNAISVKGVASLNSFFLQQGKNTFLAPAIDISCEENTCSSLPFKIKGNDEEIPVSKVELSLTGRNFNQHALSLQIHADKINFDRIFGENFYQNWYKENITNSIAVDEPGEFIPEEFSGDCIYCDKNTYEIGFSIGAIMMNGNLFKNFGLNINSQFGIVNLDKFAAEYKEGTISYKGRYNSFKERPVSFQGTMKNLDLNIINSFIPDLSFFSSGKGDMSFYFSSSVNSRDVYDFAKGEMHFDFTRGSIDLYKWFRKINYDSGKSDNELSVMPSWKFSKISGNGVIFGDKVSVKKLFIEGEDRNIAALGTFAIKPKEMDFKLAAFPLARLESIPLLGKLFADFVLYYGINGNLKKVTTTEIPSKEIPESLLESFSEIIGQTKVP